MPKKSDGVEEEWENKITVQTVSHSFHIWKVSFLAANMKREHNVLSIWELLKRHGTPLDTEASSRNIPWVLRGKTFRNNTQ